ncbi:gluconolaconase [Actinoplanes sp. SE50]|uniref:PQQ-dependent sugar dehydrogenase n=1 Tax=unclassified Actinoplanes TaxID=2626549 RepID=UPI00023EC671|nr:MULTISPECIES: gluconolaconase [unclassified Actinoplanes]AEV85891.1 L-sorbosone dehydrogenase [Actinoplanes sp. SE50/110]ATO84287.1 gluconolaconase [Actinoplanes sp. SE50]SLM01697.1 gluconolaconase [Actinoplanes sp. SE50/110]
MSGFGAANRALVAGCLALTLTLAPTLTGCSAASKPDPAGSTPDVGGADRTPEAGRAESTPATGTLVTTTVTGTDHRIQAPPGWSVQLWAELPGARLLAWTPDGRLLVSRPGAGDVVALTPGPPGTKPRQTTLVGGLDQPHGLAFQNNTLYVAESDQVDRFTYRAGAVSGERVVIAGLPDAKSPELGGAYAHALKSVAIGRDGTIFVSVGSTGNVSANDREARPQRATILQAPPGGGRPTVFARGVRNGTGLAIAPDGSVWTAVNNRDNIADPSDGQVKQSYVNDHPLEPLARLTPGRDLGWPYCNPDLDRRFVRDYQLNRDGAKLDCAKLAPIEQGLGAHSAPLGLSFATLAAPFGQGALVGVHGSWNRTPPRAPEVSFFAWRNNALGPQQTLLGGFQDARGNRWGRPVMAVQGPDQALYVSDDLAGAIYRVQATATS